MNARTQRGFGLGLGGSLSDTVVPLAILGLLIYIAVTGYGDYRARIKVLNAIEATAGIRAAIEQRFAKQPADMSQLKTAIPPRTEDIESVTIERDGVITLRFPDSVASKEQNALQIVPVAENKPLDLSLAANAGRKFAWQCGGPAGKTTLPEKLRPQNCR